MKVEQTWIKTLAITGADDGRTTNLGALLTSRQLATVSLFDLRRVLRGNRAFLGGCLENPSFATGELSIICISWGQIFKEGQIRLRNYGVRLQIANHN